MGFKDKLASAKKTNWVTEGLSNAEIKTTIDLAKISATIEQRRIDMGMTQIEFAEFMGVTQGMVSKWESREYNFTIKSLNEIFEKLDLDCKIKIDRPRIKSEYIILKWSSDSAVSCNINSGCIKRMKNEEAIA